MGQQFFITGTDTEVGKTYVTCGFLDLAKRQGLQTAALKPVAAGAERASQGLRNADAVQLSKSSTLDHDYSVINPFCFAEPVAPHLLTAKAGVSLSLQTLEQHCPIDPRADVTFIEGAGGWLLPLNAQETMADFVASRHWPVILVVGIKLGCFNHSLLTVRAIRAQCVPLLGWVANFVDKNVLAGEKIFSSLKQMINAPCLGQVEHGALAADCLSLEKIGLCYSSS